jgi:hypothetical protein
LWSLFVFHDGKTKANRVTLPWVTKRGELNVFCLMIKLIEWKKNCKCWHIGYIHYPRVSHKLVFFSVNTLISWLWMQTYTEIQLWSLFSVSSERICCLCIHIVCKNSFHNTTYIRGFDAFWLIMGRLMSFRPCVSSVKALNRRRWDVATFQSHTAFPVGLVLDYSEDGSGKFFWSIPNHFQLPVVLNLYRQHYCENLQSPRPVFTECCNGHVVVVAHSSWFSITRCQI